MATSSCHSEAMVTSRVFTASELLPPTPSLDAFTGIVESPVPRPSSTLPKTHNEPICHERLFHHFRGYVWTEKVKDTLSWAWEYGYDIHALMKLDVFCNMLNETPIYYAALALHPTFRWGWFEKQWKSRPDWVNNAKRKIQEVWDHEYRDREDGLTRVVPAKGACEEPPRKRQRLYLNSFQQFSEGGRERPTSQDSSENDDPYDSFDFDEYEEWQQTKDKTDRVCTDPIAYWHEKRIRYPRLSRMALDFLTVQSMPAECERLFPGAGRMVTPCRNRLDARTISMSQVLRSWLAAGLIEELDPLFVPATGKMETREVKDSSGEDSNASD